MFSRSLLFVSALLLAVALNSADANRKHPHHDKHKKHHPPPPKKMHHMKKSPPMKMKPSPVPSPIPSPVSSPSNGVTQGTASGSVYMCVGSENYGCSDIGNMMLQFAEVNLNGDPQSNICVDTLVGPCLQADFLNVNTGLLDVAGLNLGKMVQFLQNNQLSDPTFDITVKGYGANNNNLASPDASSEFACGGSPGLPANVCQ
ncbi:hypothetical protein CEUSTIGMA_g3969.t1 [Chlamydomonas eustigma]|uniref:Pherophorin domain-containing protein n=1 Tax=Chlamydomonas eustigma TaxID=1157962 RepID=A0A250X0C4_9CHLO|nr:hypothetical protein CEUSTIGMA_g3969.t1 [Chlamydomonas eustigma]|eukprot:GAX76523.1 hypothetical protein CEUSTIGMA_g3969.t1 [Chlamydomonas eustigma]